MHAPGANAALRALVLAGLWPWLLLTGCGHSPPPKPSAPAKIAAKPVAITPLDWLPAESFALLHLDVDQIRTQLPLPLLAKELTVEQHTLLERTHAVVIALGVVHGGAEPALAGVFIGDYDAQINPLLLAGEQRIDLSDRGREIWSTGSDVWLRTPEGHWIGGERTVADELLTPPSARAQRLSAQAWTAPPNEPYFASAALHVTPDLQAALAQVERDSFAALLAQAGPALRELRDVRISALPEGDGLRLLGLFDFASALGAASGELVLRGLFALLRAGVDELGTPAPGSPEDAAPQVLAALEAAQIGASGTRLRADLFFDGPQLAALGRMMQHARDEPAQVAVPPYQPPAPEQLAEQQRMARADRTFGKVVDKVIDLAGPDVQLRDGLHPQSGKPGTPFLVVRSTAPGAHRQMLRAALAAKRMQVVPIARGFADHPTELGIFRAQDEAAVLIARGTGEAREPGLSKRLATLVRSWSKRDALQVAVAASDYLAVELTAVPADPDRYVSELLALCPHADAAQQRAQLLERRTLDCFLQ